MQRVHKSLLQHLLALNDGQPSKHYELEHGSRVLALFELESCKTQVMKRLLEDPLFAFAKDYFLLKSLEELKESVFDGRWVFDGEIARLF